MKLKITMQQSVIILFTFFLSFILFAGEGEIVNSKRYSNKEVRLMGKIDQHKAETATIKVYAGDELVETIAPQDNGRFETNLRCGEDYTIEVQSEGFFNKRVKILAANVTKKPLPIRFNITLIDKNDLPNHDAAVMDFHWAIFEYDEKQNKFAHCEKHTKKVVKTVNKLYAKASSTANKK